MGLTPPSAKSGRARGTVKERPHKHRAHRPNGNGDGGLPEPTQQGMAQSVAIKEFYLSKLREVEYDEKLGTLVDVQAVVEEVAAVFATVRNLFLGLPAKLAPRVICCETAAAARLLIQAEVEQILRELSAEPDDDHDEDGAAA